MNHSVIIPGFVLLVGLVFAGKPAVAHGLGPYGYNSGPYYYGEFHSKKPLHGYSGWHPGAHRLYCDYDRIPVRRCNRKGRCRVVKWIIRPYCY